MAKASKNTKKFVFAKYREYYPYDFEILVPADTTAEDLERCCTSWPDSLLREGETDFDYDLAVKGEELVDGPTDFHFEMIREEGLERHLIASKPGMRV